MANQAIALQARAPQGNFLAPAIQQGAQMINMMSQQRAAERQAAVQQQQMEIQRAKEQRDITQAQIDNDGKKIDFYTKRAGQTMNAAGYELLLRDMEKDSPAFAEAFRANLPPERFDRNELLKMVGSVSDNFKATYGPLETEVVQNDDGTFMVTRTGGFDKPGAYEIPEYKLRPSGAAPATAPATPTAPATGAQPMAAPPAAAPAPAAGGMFRSAAFSPDQGADQAATLAASLTEAQGTKRIDAGTVEQIKAMVPPEAVDRFIQVNGIQVTPGGGMRSAVFRPDGNAPMAQQVQFDPNAYVATGQAARGKPLMQSPMPGSAIVPLPRVAAEARAGRETPEEVYNKKRAELKALREAGPAPLTPVQEAKLRANIAKDYKSAQATVDMMLDPTSGVIATVNAVRNLTPDQKESVTGYSGYLPSVTASSKTADTKIKNLKGKVTEMGKAAATLTGAIGQMAVQEWRIVSDMIANLDVEGMGVKDLDDQLQIIESSARRAAATTQDAYTNQYAEEFERYPNRFQLKEPQKAAGANKPLRFNPVTGGFE
jgi:hypothetical protein